MPHQNTFPSGIFVGKYRGISFYASQGKYQCLFGWRPMEFGTTRALKMAVTNYMKS